MRLFFGTTITLSDVHQVLAFLLVVGYGIPVGTEHSWLVYQKDSLD